MSRHEQRERWRENEPSFVSWGAGRWVGTAAGNCGLCHGLSSGKGPAPRTDDEGCEARIDSLVGLCALVSSQNGSALR